MNDRDFQFFGNPNQVCQGRRLHLLHDLAAVDLQRDFTYAELGCRLFVQKTADHQRQHLALPRRKRREATTQLGPLSPHRTLNVITINRGANRRNQCPLPYRFRQKIYNAALNGAHRRWDIAMSGYEDDRWMILAGKLFLEVEPVDVR